MSIGWALVLGVVQGLTEFLPVSSSGHLVILQGLLGIKAPGVTFEVTVHLGTLLAVLVVLWPEVSVLLKTLAGRGGRSRARPGGMGSWDIAGGVRLWLALIVATIPTGLIGFLGKDFFERLFASPAAAAAALLGTGVVLTVSPLLAWGRTSLFGVRGRQALLVGTAQGLAIVPGLSRSGLTITAALASGLEPDAAARFSFLLSIPAIVGAALVDFLDMAKAGGLAGAAGSVPVLSLLAGFAVAAAVGVVAVRWMIELVRRGRLRPFAYYCWAVGVATLAWVYLANGR